MIMKKELTNSKTKMRKIETSKMILIALSSSVGLLIPVVVILAFMGVPSPLEITMTGLFSLSTVAVGFYYWKAKAENLHKYKLDDKINMEGVKDHE